MHGRWCMQCTAGWACSARQVVHAVNGRLGMQCTAAGACSVRQLVHAVYGSWCMQCTAAGACSARYLVTEMQVVALPVLISLKLAAARSRVRSFVIYLNLKRISWGPLKKNLRINLNLRITILLMAQTYRGTPMLWSGWAKGWAASKEWDRQVG